MIPVSDRRFIAVLTAQNSAEAMFVPRRLARQFS
jgi:hypothetical protein